MVPILWLFLRIITRYTWRFIVGSSSLGPRMTSRQNMLQLVVIRRAVCISPPRLPAVIQELLSSARRRVFYLFCAPTPHIAKRSTFDIVLTVFAAHADFVFVQFCFYTGYGSAAIAILGFQLLGSRATRSRPLSAGHASTGIPFLLEGLGKDLLHCTILGIPFLSAPGRASRGSI
jgi:hypothetical protein